MAGGIFEIPKRLVDLILTSVFGEVAMSQGTMNNVTFGNENFSHYETLCGGSGAVIGKKGTSAVQTHMTNTAITDPEILEVRFPLRLLSFRSRMGTGGRGTWEGGDGIEREYLFLRKQICPFLPRAERYLQLEFWEEKVENGRTDSYSKGWFGL